MTRKLPASERYALALQMRRAAVSIPSNIAEGIGRHGSGEYAWFLGIARGSARELDTQLELAGLCDLLSEESVQPTRLLLDEVCRMLTSMRRKLELAPPSRARSMRPKGRTRGS